MGIFGSGRIYLDHASATPLREDARAAMRRAEDLSGNPGSIHAEGVAAKRSLEDSRTTIARVLACKPREIVFTSGLTEANNLAVLGFAQALDTAGRNIAHTHWITSSIEHPSVLECFAELERLGARVSHAEPDRTGVVAAESIARMLQKETVLVSIGWANSEIGTVQPLSDIAQAIRAHKKESELPVLFHSDAGQAPLYRAPVVHSLGVDLFSLGSGKLYGPRGVGALFAGKNAELAAVVVGGGQERGLRAGTEPVALAAGFAAALARAENERVAEGRRIKKLRDEFAAALMKRIPGAVVNGDLDRSLPHMFNISIPGVNSEYLVLALDKAGLALSTKAACSEGRTGESHVVAALGDATKGGTVRMQARERAQNTLRFSLGRETGASEIKRAANILGEVMKHLPR